MNHLCRCLAPTQTLSWCFSIWQEKMKGKNKLVPRLLGITKESVMRVEEKTKDVVQEWPLTTVKRWAASPKSFTLVLCDSLHHVLSTTSACIHHTHCTVWFTQPYVKYFSFYSIFFPFSFPIQTAFLKLFMPQTVIMNVFSHLIQVNNTLQWGDVLTLDVLFI